MSETDIENDDEYRTTIPPKWLERAAIAFGVAALLMLTGAAMVGAAFLLVLNGY